MCCSHSKSFGTLVDVITLSRRWSRDERRIKLNPVLIPGSHYLPSLSSRAETKQDKDEKEERNDDNAEGFRNF